MGPRGATGPTEQNKHQIRAAKSGWDVVHRVDREPRLRIEYAIDKAALASAIDSVGVTQAQETVAYQEEAELERIVEARKAAFLGQGIEQTLVGEEIVLRPAFDALARRGADGVRVAAEQIVRSLPSGAAERTKVERLANFVQSFENSVPAQHRLNSHGEPLMTAGIRHPVETLYTGEGDCDSLGVLFAALMDATTRTKRIFLAGMVEGQRHLMVGVRLIPEKGDLFIEYDDHKWVVFDLTHGSRGSLLTARGKALVKGKDFEVIEAP